MNKLREQILQIKEDNLDTVFYINLTNGLEALPILHELNIEPKFLNIQSTQLEQKHYSTMMERLGPDFLMDVALGRNIVIIDYGARKELSRAIYKGVTFIKYALERIWFEKEPERILIRPRSKNRRLQDVTREFDRYYHTFPKSLRHYLRRFKPYVLNEDINLEGISFETSHDGDKEFYRNIVKTCNI